MDEAVHTRSAIQLRPAPVPKQSSSYSNFKSRTEKFLKRLSGFTNKKPKDAKALQNPYQRQVRSMDVMHKPYMSQPMLALRTYDLDDPNGFDESSETSNSPRSSSQLPSQILPKGRSSISGLPPSSSHRRSLSSTGRSTGGALALASITAGASSTGFDGLPAHSTEPGLIIAGDHEARRLQRTTVTASSGNPPQARFSLPMTKMTSPPTPPPQSQTPSQHPPLASSSSRKQDYPSSSESDRRRSNMLVVASESSSGAHGESGSTISGSSPNEQTRDSASNSSTPQHTLRRAAPRLKSLPPAIFTRLTADGERLSPAIVPRPTPMPILNLPSLPVPTPTPARETMPPRVRLASVPALPRHGPTDRDMDSDHENATLEEEEEEDDYHSAQDVDGPASDDDEGDDSSPGVGGHPLQPPNVLETPRGPMPGSSRFPLQTPTRQKYEAANSSSGAPFDYFSNLLSGSSGNDNLLQTPGRSPRELGERTLIPRQPRTPSQVMPLPTPGSVRPSIYRHASRSCIDIFSTKPDCLGVGEDGVIPAANSTKGKGKAREFSEIGPSSTTTTTKPATAATVTKMTMMEQPQTVHTTGSAAPAYDKLSHPLRRRRSMPTFNPATLPPPYPHFAPHPMGLLGKNVVIQPRDDEGRERLPAYSNSIYLKAILPRKMEFSAPGVQAKDRKWRRVLCVLEGTAFKVYKCPPGASGVGVLGEWWEKKVGVGDVTVPLSPEALQQRLDANRRRVDERGSKFDTESGPKEGTRSPPPPQMQTPTPSKESKAKKRLTASFLRPQAMANSRTHSRTRSEAVPPSEAVAMSIPRPSLNLPRGSQSPNEPSTSAASSVRSSMMSSSHAGGSSGPPSVMSGGANSSRTSLSSSSVRPAAASHFMAQSSSSTEPDVDESMAELVRTYTLQHAESGLGNDYLKRKNVIRVRMEGEQFLLQAQNIAAVVEWIEGFHAATNISLDLDERPMPKGPMFPRRRRRRPRPAENERPNDSRGPNGNGAT